MNLIRYFLGASVVLNSIRTVSNYCISNNQTKLISYMAVNDIYNNSINCDCEEQYTCVRKCCKVNYYLQNDQICVYKNNVNLKVPIYKYGNVIIDSDPINSRFIFGMIKCAQNGNGFYEVESKDFFVQKDGRLWLPIINTYFSHENYCLEYDEKERVLAYLCVLEYEIQGLKLSERLTIIGMIISLPFLLITFVIYAILPLRNIHGKALMCYVFALFGTYLLHVSVHLYPDSETFSAGVCRTIAMLYLFLFVASFFWMNVMCIDIWWTFSGSKGFIGNTKRTERKLFLIYSAYAWGAPFLLVVLIIILSSTLKRNTWYNPGITEQQCWLNDGIPTLIYLYLPMAALITANMTLFAITAYKIRQIQQDTAMLRKGDNKHSREESDKQRFIVYLKLFLAMGVNWSMEIISWAVNWQVEHVPPSVWYLTEFCNAAFGVFIFFIFVFKKNIWKLLKKRYYTMVGKPYAGRSSFQATNVSTIT